ncbi:MAG: hypothetical protein RIC36_04470 [Rhodospirillales bacterium]
MAMRSGFFCLTLLGTALLPTLAQADAIDGHWCKGVSILSIDGPKIMTPGGTSMQGSYDRHGFEYFAPAGEADAGQTVVMVLHGDDLMRLRRSNQPDTVEDWHRCQKTVS